MRYINQCSETFLEEYEGGSINTASPDGDNSASKNKEKADISNSLDL